MNKFSLFFLKEAFEEYKTLSSNEKLYVDKALTRLLEQSPISSSQAFKSESTTFSNCYVLKLKKFDLKIIYHVNDREIEIIAVSKHV